MWVQGSKHPDLSIQHGMQLEQAPPPPGPLCHLEDFCAPLDNSLTKSLSGSSCHLLPGRIE